MTDSYSKQADKFLYSSYYEKLVEHLFIADILQTAWLNGQNQIEISRAEIDNSGYDLILECNQKIRHIQLKCSAKDSKTTSQKVNIKLADKPSGCVIWIKRGIEKKFQHFTLSYLFFGGKPGKQLPNLTGFKTAKHTKGNATGEKKLRPNIKTISKGAFYKVNDTKELLNLLFDLKTPR